MHRQRERVYPLLIALYGGLRNGFALFLCGASLGWLMGMSTSPVLQTVLATLLAIIATLLTATLGLAKSSDNPGASLTNTLSGLSGKMLGQPASERPATEPPASKPVQPYNALPLGWFLFCLATGAAGGIFTRTNELLGTIPGVVAGRLGVSPTDSALVAKRLLDDLYGLSVSRTNESTTKGATGAVASRFSAAALFSDVSDSVDFCASVKYLNGPELQDELNDQITDQLNRNPAEPKRRGLEQMQRLLTKQQSEGVLRQIKDQLCAHR